MTVLLSQNKKGFTLIETLVAIFILVICVTAFMSVTKNNFSLVRYSRNQMIATTLMQESLEYIRNNRDTFMQEVAAGVRVSTNQWDDWQHTFNVDTTGQIQDGALTSGCYSASGCYIDPYTTGPSVIACSTNTPCPYVTYYPNQVLYAYKGTYGGIDPSDSYLTSFARKITITPATADQVIITSTVSWNNDAKLLTQSQSIVLTNWIP